MDVCEKFISNAEIAYKSGKTRDAISFAKRALKSCGEHSQIIALKIFIARCHSKIGNFAESNRVYRELLCEKIYIAPVVFGLFYNNFEKAGAEKMNLNLRLVKSCLLLPQ